MKKTQTVDITFFLDTGDLPYWPDIECSVPWYSAKNQDEALKLSISAVDPFQSVCEKQ
jgi:hypothetical protein